jgi:sulfotransferase famil protein
MLISEKLKIIFISNPKSGTTFIQNQLMKIDRLAQLNKLPDLLFFSKQISGVDEHITAAKLKSIIGGAWESYKKIVFIRNPFDKAVSGYFFTKMEVLW